MWQAEEKTIDGNTTKYIIKADGIPMTFAEVIAALISDSAFALYFNSVLATSTYQAYFWEVKPVSQITVQSIFEFVLINSNSLTCIQADSTAFSEYLDNERYAASFKNLGGDSVLIAPADANTGIGYAHLAQFVRSAPSQQVTAYWKLVGEELNKAISTAPKWLSTSGLAVYWLHVRIDPTPKYYNYLPYRSA